MLAKLQLPMCMDKNNSNSPNYNLNKQKLHKKFFKISNFLVYTK